MAQISYGTITITDTTDIESIKNWYLATNASSGVTKATSGWTDTIQQMTASKQYLWNYEQILGANNTEISSTLPVIIGHYGINGQNGTDGNSITSIDEYYQATNSTTNPGSSGWQKNTLVTPTSTNKYLWNYQVINYSKTAAEGSYNDARIIGVYGDKGEPGNPGTNGINTATVYLYQRAASAPTKPSGSLTYTFSSAEITSGTLGNWKQSIGELTGTDPIWVIAAVASSNGTTDTIASTEWSTQIKLAQNGTDGQPGSQGAAGLNQATVFIYKRASSATAPSSTTYTFSNGDFTVPSGWSKTIPASDGNPCYVTSAVAIGNGTTATLTWNTPSVLVEDGIDGISPTVTSTSNGVKIVDADGNETYITNGANGQSYYTYIRYSANSNGSGMVTTPTSSTKYIGVYSGTSSTVPAYTAFTWSKYVGDPGTPATQYYAFVKYATDANGSNMQDSPDSTHIYVGTYTGTSSSPAASAYQWSKYVGDPGTPATQYYAFIKYATNSSGANMTDTPTANTKYVGTYAGTNSSPAAVDYKWSIYVGTNGVSVTQTRELYYLKTNSTDPSQITASNQITTTNRQNGWTSIVPTYVANAEYWTCIETSLSEGGPVWSTPIKNNALTDENYHAWQSLLISQNANENAQGSLSIAQDIHQHFWENATDYVIPNSNPFFTLPAGAYITDTLISTFKGDNGPTGGYMLTRSDGLWIGSGKYRLAALTGSALGFYEPGTTLLNSNDETYLDAKLDANGLVLKKGGIKAGTAGQSGFIYLSTENYGSNLTINSHQASNWREIIGTKFGVDADGNLYASNAEISGKITVGSGSNVYTKTEANGAFDALGAADTAESNAVATAAADATSKANAAQAAAETTAAQDATAKANAVNTALETYKTATNSTLNSLQDQVDGQVEVWYYSIDPTNSNPPASSWDTDTLKARHEGDLYYNINNGHSWRWLKNGSTYSWQQIPDGDAAAALAKATEALGLAGDKRRIFTTQPIPPYDVGDLWADGSQIKYCSTSKSEGQSYAATDWTLTATDDTKANSAAYEEQYIYISKVSGTGSVTKYETWVIRSDDVQNIWTTKRPTYDSSYPVLFIAKQKKTVGQSSGTTCSCTTPVKDDTVTVIDGGHITTGTIDASRLSVYDATINKISASAIDVSSIQIGQSQVNNLTNDLSNKASISAEYSVNIVTSNFNPTATGTDTFITLTAKVSRVDGTAVGTISYAWYGDNSSTAISGATSASYNVPANLVWNGTTGYKTFTVQVN